MNIYKYFDSSQTIWVYPTTYSQFCEEYGKTSNHPYYKTLKLPTDGTTIHSYHKHQCIFECKAEDILEADKFFEEALNSGKVQLKSEKSKPKIYAVTKMPNIYVTFEKNDILEPL